MKKNLFTTKNISGLAVFSAISFILSLPIFEIPVFFGVYKLDFSNVFVLLGGFMYGPFGGVIVLIIKELLHIPVGSTGGVGELANLIVGLSFILFPTIRYTYKKGFKNVIISLVIACIIQTGVGLLANKIILLPFFGCAENFAEWWPYILIFNAIKSIACSAFAVLLYKKLSYLFKKINLQETYGGDIIERKETDYNSMISTSEKETRQIAFNYAKTLSRGDVVLLYGDLGAGKTAFIKGVCAYFKLDGVCSPTYTYLNVYGDFIYHYDCYRLSCGEDAEALGLTDYFNGDNICFIEWPTNIESVLPENCKKITIEKLDENKRKITL